MRLRTLVAVLGVAMLALAAVQPVEKVTLDRWMQELSNWGRWGKNDQLRTVNLITPAKRRAAAALVKEGFTVSLSSDAETVQSAHNEFPVGRERSCVGTGPNRSGGRPRRKGSVEYRDCRRGNARKLRAMVPSARRGDRRQRYAWGTYAIAGCGCPVPNASVAADCDGHSDV